MTSSENRKPKTENANLRLRIFLTGVGGQGTLLASRVLGEAALEAGYSPLVSETHGMAQRGGTVISMIKVGPFRGPLIPAGQADVGLFLHPKNLGVHRFYLKPAAAIFVNSGVPGDYQGLDAASLARQMGASVAANLILLGYAAAKGGLFCQADFLEQVIREKVPARFREINLKALAAGAAAAGA